VPLYLSASINGPYIVRARGKVTHLKKAVRSRVVEWADLRNGCKSCVID
jgi:hypothetical protein